MSKITITVECDDADDARSVIDQLTNRAVAPQVTTEKTAAPVEQTKTVEEVKAPLDPDDAAVDSDGMPWSEAVHASSRAVNTDGTWKARKGQAAAAKTARAEFKASGGNVKAPAGDATEEAPATNGLPGVKTAPGLPGAENIPTAEPVTFDQFVEKATAVLASEKIDGEGISALYCDVTGETDVAEAAAKLETNETMRRAAVDRLTEIENG